MRRHARLLLQLLFWSAAAFASVMAVLPHPPDLPGDPSDKVQHILAFAVLTALALAAFAQSSPLRIGVALGLLGVAIEVVQMIPKLHRDASALDWVADCAAVLVVLAIGTPLRQRLRSRTDLA